jgi:hypothetical protein
MQRRRCCRNVLLDNRFTGCALTVALMSANGRLELFFCSFWLILAADGQSCVNIRKRGHRQSRVNIPQGGHKQGSA